MDHSRSSDAPLKCISRRPSGKQTIGLLHRRHVRIGRIIYIGRESNRVEEVEAGIIHSAQAPYMEEWIKKATLRSGDSRCAS